eukprot:TRINITY_DN1813_c0_g1_i1.p1 TRINITY_DN1813_c0_g1~~TRINITY_DN1813_c0_g1_i1.p1  ORF type:complete len:137 (-),score=35.01 TRINITY_DN1813_c0_g1_i1:500-910(-)
MPLADTTGVGCAKADAADACVLQASGCLGGCSGQAAAQLAAFSGCFEGSFKEMLCIGAKTKDVGCVAQAGIDSVAYGKCIKDPSEISKIQQSIKAAAGEVHSFPKVMIGAKDASNAAQDPTQLKAALCKAGLQAAC